MRRIHDVPEKGTLQFLLNAFLGAYNRRTDVIARQASGGDAQKLDAVLKNQAIIIDMLTPLGMLPSTIGLMETRLETIHGLLADLISADPEKIKELAASVKAAREKLQTSLDNQQKGD